MNLILFGLGPHAKRIYLKLIKKYNLNLKVIVDLESKKNEIEDIIEKEKLRNVDLFLIPDLYRNSKEFSVELENALENIILKNKITHSIISTEPKSHYIYAKLCLKHEINILMDKPITALENLNSSLKNIEELEKEYNELKNLFNSKLNNNPKLVFSIQCQRRFHAGYQFIKELLQSVIEEYRVPITNIDIYHADGMWNMPDEILERENHPYKYGYGKLLHSGYHFIDLLTWIIEENMKIEKIDLNRFSVYSEKYTPNDFYNSFGREFYNKVFSDSKDYSEEYNENNVDKFGELDINSIISFYSDKNKITTSTINLLNNSFSRRSWRELPEDTYKSNGRIRHERCNIQIGPLMNIQVHSYQSYEISERSDNESDIGSLEHFDILIFRNSGIIGGKPFEKIQLKDLKNINKENLLGHNEYAREKCFKEFLEGKRNDSDINKHNLSIQITKNIYKSMIKGVKIMEELNDKIIYEITDKDFGITEITNDDEPITRYGARGIVVDQNGKIALVNKTVKNEYKLPGGGVDKGEEYDVAFSRECEEELGVKVGNIKYLGDIVEYKSQENFKQVSKVFVSTVEEYLESNNLTQKEIDEGTKITWVELSEAIGLVEKSLENLVESEYDNVYRSKFMVLRDLKILEYYSNNN